MSGNTQHLHGTSWVEHVRVLHTLTASRSDCKNPSAHLLGVHDVAAPALHAFAALQPRVVAPRLDAQLDACCHI